MAGSGGDRELQAWLTDKLHSLSSDIDTDVFVSYIIGILDTDSQEEDDIQESITELLSGVVEEELAKKVCSAILEQWHVGIESRKLSLVQEDVGDKLSTMFQKQTLATVKEKKLSKDEADRKAAILAQYGQVSDGDESDTENLSNDESSTPSSSTTTPGAGVAKVKGDSQDFTDPLRVRNVNKDEVQRVERDKREKAKEEQEKKKEKDKQDRQAQKQKQQERKESEKKRTQKGEKRR